MGASRPARGGLTVAQIELLTDVMVSKLSMIATMNRNNPDHPAWLKDVRPVNRDEVRLVVTDTAILVAAEDPAATLDLWGCGMKLVASAVVRNEADRYLEIWLRHLLTFCDEVRLLDDGSSDITRSLAMSMGTEVQVASNEGLAFLQMESDARNALLDWTIQGQPDYVLCIDADEFVGDGAAIRRIITGEHLVYSLTMREVWKVDGDQLGLRVDGLWGDRRCPLLWRAPREFRGSAWRVPRRKLACGREPQVVRANRGHDTGVGVYHFGWTNVAEREARAERYFEHDGGRYHASKHLQSILWPDEKVGIEWVAWPPSIPEGVVARAAA